MLGRNENVAALALRVSRVAVFALRDMELEPCTLLVLPGLADGYAGDGEDLLHEEQSKAGIPAKPLPEDICFIKGRDPDAIVIDTEGNSTGC